MKKRCGDALWRGTSALRHQASGVVWQCNLALAAPYWELSCGCIPLVGCRRQAVSASQDAASMWRVRGDGSSHDARLGRSWHARGDPAARGHVDQRVFYKWPSIPSPEYVRLPVLPIVAALEVQLRARHALALAAVTHACHAPEQAVPAAMAPPASGVCA